MKYFFVIALLTSSFAGAKVKTTKLESAASAQALSLREQAMIENQTTGENKASATDAQVPSGMLRLEDPRPKITPRSWLYFAGLTAQSFRPMGTVTTDSVGNFDLGANGSTFMPGLVVGFLSPAMITQNLQWRLGVRGDGALSSQNVSLTYPNGFKVDDARLNTTMISVGPTLNLVWDRYAWLALSVTPQYGTLNYTQTSSNNYARFSQSAAYFGVTTGLEFKVAQRWAVTTEYSNRSLRDSTQEIALQKDNFELGTKVTW